jgi:glycine/D-amino acid oxidase-like deaminating enzyme
MNSLWSETTEQKSRKALKQDIQVDVLIVGGGMCGILIAHKLKEKGVNSVVVEAKTVGGGVTQNTTAKITAQHGLIYADLIQKLGEEKARMYYDANTKAIEKYRKLSANFSCDFENKTAYVYSVNDRNKLEHEAEAYDILGLKSKIVEVSKLPFKTVGALAMENQGQFHPLKLLYALADDLKIYENTFVNKIEENIAYTKDGKIIAKHIVLATHYPLINIPGLYFTKLYQSRSYVIAVEKAPLLDGMYIDAIPGGYSFRTYGDLLFIGGGSHRTGENGGNYEELEGFINSTYPNAKEEYRWATQDCMSLDKVPYIGRHQKNKENLYVATGFNKWGMTGSMVAAEVLTDLIVDGKSEWQELYNPSRSILTGKLFTNFGAATKGLLSVGGPRCTHMGCKLHWNVTESTWDCHCHGSRFDEEGHVINNPAKKQMKQ